MGVSPDGLTWTFTLRKGVTWHDGKPFTSADAKFSIEVYKDEKINSILRSNLAPVNRIETPNENTSCWGPRISSRRCPEILCYLGFMLPKHLLEGKDMTKPPEEFINNPIGTGPFKFVEHVRGDHLTVAAYDGFYLGRPKVDQVIFKIIPDVNTTVAQVRNGELDIAFVGTSHLDALKGADEHAGSPKRTRWTCATSASTTSIRTREVVCRQEIPPGAGLCDRQAAGPGGR